MADPLIDELADVFLTLDRGYTTAVLGWSDPTAENIQKASEGLLVWLTKYHPSTFEALRIEINQRSAAAG